MFKQRQGLILLALLAAGTTVRAQSPSFSLSFDAPSSATGTAGASLDYTATGRLTTAGLTDLDPGAQAWSLSMAAEVGVITDVTTDGTSVDALENGGFKKTELTTGASNEGAVSAVVLSFMDPVTLPPTGSVDVVRLTVTVTVPDPVVDEAGDPSCAPAESRVLFVNGRQGSGLPVINKVTWTGDSFLPELGSATTSICPVVVKPLSLRVDITGGSPEPQSSSLVNWNVSVPVGTTSVPVRGEVILTSDVPGSGGVQGWSLSVLTGDCFGVNQASTDGTVVDTLFTGGFKKTEIVDPAKNAGLKGAVSAVVLSFTETRSLPEVGESLLLFVRGTVDSSSLAAGGDETAPCSIRLTSPTELGLRGAGQPVKTAVTVEGSTRNPGTVDSTVTIVGAISNRFVRGNANNDGKNDIADAVWIVNTIFRAGPASTCQDAADANDDGLIDLSDALYIIGYQFQGQSPPPAPFPNCGTDDSDDLLPCEATQTNC